MSLDTWDSTGWGAGAFFDFEVDALARDADPLLDPLTERLGTAPPLFLLVAKQTSVLPVSFSTAFAEGGSCVV